MCKYCLRMLGGPVCVRRAGRRPCWPQARRRYGVFEVASMLTLSRVIETALKRCEGAGPTQIPLFHTMR